MDKKELKRVEDLKYIDKLFSELARRGVKQIFDGLLEVRPMRKDMNVELLKVKEK